MALSVEQLQEASTTARLGITNASANAKKGMFFYELDLKKNCILHVSSSVRGVVGYSPEEIIQSGLKWFVEQIHEDDLENLRQLADRQSHSAIVPWIHYRFKSKDGAFCRLYECRCLLYDSNGNPSFLIGKIGNNDQSKPHCQYF